jgi:hypothetical protein
LGRDYDDDHSVEFRNTFTNNMIRDPVRGTAAFETTSGSKYTVEELVAMQFSLAKQQAEETAGEMVKDVVITVSFIVGTRLIDEIFILINDSKTNHFSVILHNDRSHHTLTSLSVRLCWMLPSWPVSVSSP